MGRKKKNRVLSANSELYVYSETYTTPEGRVIEKNEIIKIAGEHGVRFKFKSHVIRTDSGIDWIDCYELERGISAKHRSFRTDRLKALPKKRIKRSV